MVRFYTEMASRVHVLRADALFGSSGDAGAGELLDELVLNADELDELEILVGFLRVCILVDEVILKAGAIQHRRVERLP